jgi:putative addiction module component (TIGR02574 family)
MASAHHRDYHPIMADTLQAVAAQALALDPGDRLLLAAQLIDSVEGPADPRWTAVWRTELRRRTKAADQRDVRGSGWTEVRARLLRELAEE